MRLRLLIFLLLVLPASAQSLEGTWRTSGQLPPSSPNGQPFSWMKEYTFSSDGTYVMTGYPPIEDHGSYEISAQIDSGWKVRLYNRIFQNEAAPEVVLELKWEAFGKFFTVGKDRYDRQRPNPSP